MPVEEMNLRLSFHGKIVDHLGIQMYQSPVASLAELVANAWDADAELVEISLPASREPGAQIIIKDSGVGMTAVECEERYLKIGYNRRTTPTDRTPDKKRPVLGRKGIGKFAGFGIARTIIVDTVSGVTGERTVFKMELDNIRGDQYYATGGTVPLLEYDPPDEARKASAGTKITLADLTLGRKINSDSFARSMARRFLLHQQQDDFKVLVNGKVLPEAVELSKVEFRFPLDYSEEEQPSYMEVPDQQGWAWETVSLGKRIRWRFFFHKETIDEEELRGIVIFVNGKVAQTPFLFNITGGLKGQHGVEYLSGQVEASYLDEYETDLVATDRQSINWQQDESKDLLDWGARRVRELLKLWQDRRGLERRKKLEAKLAGFTTRLANMTQSEAKTVKTALARIGSIATLTDAQFEDLGSAVLTAWEKGRLKSLIEEISNSQFFSADEFVSVLKEADVLSALSIAEVVKTKLEAIKGLEKMVEDRQLENAVRDYISQKPWLLDPKWETYRVETTLKHILDDAAQKAGLSEEASAKRVDLALRSNDHVLVVEFMRPGKPLDWDHLSRCLRYIRNIRVMVEGQSALGIRVVSGLIVADKIVREPDVFKQIDVLRNDQILAYDWHTLIAVAKSQWREFLDAVVVRSPEDARVRALSVESTPLQAEENSEVVDAPAAPAIS